MRSKTSLSTQDLRSKCFASANCLEYPFTSWAEASSRARDLILALIPAVFPQVVRLCSNTSRVRPSTLFGTSTCILLKLLVISLRYNDRCTHGIVVKSQMSADLQNKMIQLPRHTCVSGIIVQCSSSVRTWRSGKGIVLPESWLCALYSSLYSLSSSPELALPVGSCELAAGPCELAAGPCWKGRTSTVDWDFEEVPGSFWCSSSSSSEFTGLYFLAFFCGLFGWFLQYLSFLSVFVDPISVHLHEFALI